MARIGRQAGLNSEKACDSLTDSLFYGESRRSSLTWRAIAGIRFDSTKTVWHPTYGRAKQSKRKIPQLDVTGSSSQDQAEHQG